MTNETNKINNPFGICWVRWRKVLLLYVLVLFFLRNLCLMRGGREGGLLLSSLLFFYSPPSPLSSLTFSGVFWHRCRLQPRVQNYHSQPHCFCCCCPYHHHHVVPWLLPLARSQGVPRPRPTVWGSPRSTAWSRAERGHSARQTWSRAQCRKASGFAMVRIRPRPRLGRHPWNKT